MKAIILRTDQGLMLLGQAQTLWLFGKALDAEGCYEYCHSRREEWDRAWQSHKLVNAATFIDRNEKTSEFWFDDRNNFIDVKIPYDCCDK